MRQALKEVPRRLRQPKPKAWLWDSVSLRGLEVSGAGLPRAEVERARSCWREVADRGGPGSPRIAEGLLGLVGSALDPADVPFWLEVLALTRPRGRAAAWLAPALVESGRKPDAEVEAALARMATQDKDFLTRLAARRALASVDRPLPLAVPDGSYVFEVRLAGWDERWWRERTAAWPAPRIDASGSAAHHGRVVGNSKRTELLRRARRRQRRHDALVLSPGERIAIARRLHELATAARPALAGRTADEPPEQWLSLLSRLREAG